jgi:cyclopropane fatty-acyl-phospholipid synthase-like methyltransferase
MLKVSRSIVFNLSYFFHPRWDTGIPAPELLRFILGKPPGKAIDIGCGTGTNLLTLAQHQWTITGIDYAPLAIRKARNKLKGYPATLLLADVARLRFLDLPGLYDLALDMGCFHSLSVQDRKAYVQGLEKWIARNGVFMVYAFQPSNPDDNKGVSKADMIGYFQEKFVLQNYEQGQGRPSAWYYFVRKE